MCWSRGHICEDTSLTGASCGDVASPAYLSEREAESQRPDLLPAAPVASPAAGSKGAVGAVDVMPAARPRGRERRGEAVWRDSGRRGTGNGSDRCVRACGGSGPARTVASHSQVRSPALPPRQRRRGAREEDHCAGTGRVAVQATGGSISATGTQRWRARGLSAAPQTGSQPASSAGIAKALQQCLACAGAGARRHPAARPRRQAAWPCGRCSVLHWATLLHFPAPNARDCSRRNPDTRRAGTGKPQPSNTGIS